ncbi:UDP-N-acetylmuramate dehydrogenase [Marinomonas transparens]|uniref:UDP-N-acetylenolpyruvoylglucosamine reductase n=1 Tax=Marinomonas transparens TaxID=2795388 RepID=A0A934N027_9GAMM|nr:UDP-N-acetylmuramate dehydrogenase [Marinomonas transparens]MBJ7538150.1 UDP-N-acetylmuramate dehydrogenase [Marinomonas transparens]
MTRSLSTTQPVRPGVVQQGISLLAYNTFRFHYQAEYFALAETLESLKELLAWANHQQLEVTIIGGGSNLLISADIRGLVIINQLSGIKSRELGNNRVSLTVAAGENWHHVVEHAVNQGWFGIENLALIPGTTGAAPVQNIGAYGVEVKDAIARVQVIDRISGDVYWVLAVDCGFAYRDSHFKGKWKDKYCITSVEFSLKKRSDFVLSYGGLANQITGDLSLLNVFRAVCKIRSEKLPDPNELANSGSFFKNPIVDPAKHDELKAAFPNLVSFPFGDDYKLAAGWLIDQAGWKGKKYQGVGVYEKQALVLVNYSEESAQALLALEAKIKASVFERYGVELEREPVQLPLLTTNPIDHGESIS